MAITIGINGFGRIGRVAFRIAINQPEKFKICGINVRNADLDYMIYMIRYDSIFGRFQGSLEKYEDGIVVNGEKIRVYSENDAADIPWGECGAEYIIDATGAYCTTEKAMAHIRGGAKKVIISAPAKDQDTPTFVMGVNHELYQSSMQVVSNASCTTNCLAPICKVLEDNYGIEYGLMSTIHSATAKQKVVDLAKIISKYVGPIRLHVVNFTDIQLYIYEKCPHEELTIIMRRYMMRIAEHFAKADGCLGMITGESIGQVASQTMHSLAATNDVCTLPVYRPVIGFDKQEIVDISEKIDTYETSIQPYEDCCTIFVAKHPVTKPNIEVIRRSEEKLAEKIDAMVQEAIDTVEVIEVTP